MALESERRRYLFDRARNHGVDEAALHMVALAVLDAHIAAGDGAEVQAWIPRAAPTAAMQSEIWSGDRGVAILALGPDAGFRERAAISLHRGVDDLARGDLESALRAFAFALSEAHEATDPDAVASLSRRWLSHVAGRIELDEELVATLRVLVPGRDFSVLLEDLMWRAAFHADIESFEMGEAALPGRSALNRRLEALRPLAAGDAADFTRGVHGGLDRSPSETLRLLTQLVERLEREDAETRRRQIPLLTALRAISVPCRRTPMRRPVSVSRRRPSATGWSMLEGLGIVGDDAPDRARSVDPTAEVFVGSVRLAPRIPCPGRFPHRRCAAWRLQPDPSPPRGKDRRSRGHRVRLGDRGVSASDDRKRAARAAMQDRLDAERARSAERIARQRADAAEKRAARREAARAVLARSSQDPRRKRRWPWLLLLLACCSCSYQTASAGSRTGASSRCRSRRSRPDRGGRPPAVSRPHARAARPGFRRPHRP